MSLLEDIFLRDEANEAQELERIIDGEEFEERARSDSDNNSEKEDEAEEDKRRVEPNTTKVKRVTRNPRFVLNPARLTGPRGIQVIPEHFKDFKFKGKGHEKEDLDLILKKLEHWAYRLYPKFQFEDCLKKIETLGKKRPVMVHLQKIRSDQFVSDETVVQRDSSDEETPAAEPEDDEFDRLLQQQIDLARSTPAPTSAKKSPSAASSIETRLITIPKATSSPSISDEQRERMLKSRRIAEKKRLARLKNNSVVSNITTSSVNQAGIDIIEESVNPVLINKEAIIDIEDAEIGKVKRLNKSNVIDSSDDEDTPITCVESVTVDIHSNHKIISQIETAKNQEDENIDNITVNSLASDGIDAKSIDIVTDIPKLINSDMNINKENAIEASGNNSHERDKEETNTIINDNIENDKLIPRVFTMDIPAVGETDDVLVNSILPDSGKVPDTEVSEIMDVDFSEEF